MRPKALVLVVLLAGVPRAGFAQAALAGSVTDPSDSAIRGVLVTASSPVLIEKARTAVTDGNGQYRIEDLRPGVYTVTFSLAGWRSHRQDDVELTGSSTTSVNAELQLGPHTDSVTVTGNVPVVDVRSVTRGGSLAGEVVRTIPTARSYNALLVLLPGIVTSSNDIVTGTATTSFPIHGGRTNEGRLSLNGLTVGSPPNGNSATSYVVDLGNALEVTFMTAGGLGEVETAGLVMNIVPKTGSNTTQGSLFVSASGSRLQSDNLTDALEDQGVTAGSPLSEIYDVWGTLGGPVIKDRVWYFVNAHVGGSTKKTPNVYYNLNAGDPQRWLYAPDTQRLAYSDRTFEDASARVTWQVTPRQRVGGFWDAQALCRTCTGATAGLAEPARVSPEAVGVLGRRFDVAQATWAWAATDRFLLDAGFGATVFGFGNFEREPNPTRDLIRVVEQCARGCAANGNIPGLVYRSQDFSVAHAGSYLWKGALSYVTGSHSLKIGYQHTLMTDDRTLMTNNQGLTYRFDNGVPNQITQSISPWVNDARVAWNGLFVQEQWTRHRLTLHGAVRFDRARSWFPAQQEGPSRFLSTAILVPETRGVDSYTDISPRVGLAYDVSGRGTTALRLSVGKYLEGAGVSGNYAFSNPTLRMPRTTPATEAAGVSRAWTDTNQNFVPDCDLSNPGLQDLRATGGDLCGVLSNVNFGKPLLINNFDHAILEGWGVRPSDWNLALSIQQQIGSRSSVDVTYSRRSYDGFFVVDNLALQPSDLTPFSITAPRDPRLPGGGGYVVSGLFDVVPEKAGQVDNFVTDSSRFGPEHHYFNGIDVTYNLRATRGLSMMVGTSTGQSVADSCAVRERLPELATTTVGTSAFGPGLNGSAVTPLSPYCHVAFGILTQVRGFSSYLMPKLDVQLAVTFQSKPGPMLAANYAVPTAAAAASLGRNLSANAANATVNLVEPGTMYGNRINQLDLRVAKRLTRGRLRTLLSVDIYNTLNSSAVLTYNNSFVPDGPWLQPLTILSPRFLKVAMEMDF